MADILIGIAIGWLALNAIVAAWAILGGNIRHPDRFYFREVRRHP